MNLMSQADIRNSHSLFAHNQRTALRFIRFMLHVFEVGDFLDLVKISLFVYFYDFIADFYKQFEELSYKLDSLLEENKNLKNGQKSETQILKEIKKHKFFQFFLI